MTILTDFAIKMRKCLPLNACMEYDAQAYRTDCPEISGRGRDSLSRLKHHSHEAAPKGRTRRGGGFADTGLRCSFVFAVQSIQRLCNFFTEDLPLPRIVGLLVRMVLNNCFLQQFLHGACSRMRECTRAKRRQRTLWTSAVLIFE